MRHHLRTSGQDIRRKSNRMLGLALCLALLAAACGDGTTETTAAQPTSTSPPGTAAETTSPPAVTGGTLTIAEGLEITEIDPAPTLIDHSWRIHSLVYETLVTSDGVSEFFPGLAESWEETSPTEVVFHLREGATFSNGRPVTADDVVGSLQRLLDPEAFNFWALMLSRVTGIEAPDERTVKIELSSPFQQLFAALSHTPASILPMQELEDGSFDPTVDLLGSGPMMVAEHVANESWTLTHNPYYESDATPIIDELQILIITDPAARIAALRDGRIAIGFWESPDTIGLLEGIPDVEVTPQAGSGYVALELNAVNPESPFADDVRVRQAVAYALDRQAMSDLVFDGWAEPSGATPRGLVGSCDPAGLPTYTRDVDMAVGLLADAGAEGLTFELMASAYSPTFVPLAEVIQQSLAEAGIEVVITTPEVGAWIDALYVQYPSTFEGALDVFAGWMDPAMVMQYWDPTLSFIAAGFMREYPELAALIKAAIETPPGDERNQVLADACRLAAEDANVIPLVSQLNTVVGVRSDIVSAPIRDTEFYGITLRNLPEFTLLEP